jgi:uroporphyrinogen-III synthase
VLVTRPGPSSAALCEAVVDAGGECLSLPGVEIRPLARGTVLHELRPEPRAEAARLAVFVSPNAVAHGAWLLQDGPLAGAAVAAIGATTAGALQALGIDVTVQPADGGYTSEALLAHPALQAGTVAREVVIVRGRGGRDLLAASLRARGAHLRLAEVYERVAPAADGAAAAITRIRRHGPPQLLTATSGEILDNVLSMLGEAGTAVLRDTRVVVPSERLVDAVRQAGFRHPALRSAGADNAALMRAITAWWTAQSRSAELEPPARGGSST